VGVVEFVAEAVADPEPPAAEFLPADAVEGSVRDRDHGCAKRCKDVVAVVPVAGDVAAESAVGVDVVGLACDGEDVVAEPERGRHRQRLAELLRAFP
jgi:hypothetical protein